MEDDKASRIGWGAMLAGDPLDLEDWRETLKQINPSRGEHRGQLGAGKGRRNSLPAHAARSSPISNGTDRLAIPSRPTRTRQSVFPVASG
jgi:hypothetical protein